MRGLNRFLSMKDQKGLGLEKNRKYTKSNLPSKICSVCKRPFEWRKKWVNVWDDVKYCSDKCRMNRSRRDLSMCSSKFGHKQFHTFSWGKPWCCAFLLFSVSSTEVRASSGSFEVHRIVSTISKEEADEPFTEDDFRRLDEKRDILFYSSPRLVEHIDISGSHALTNFQSNWVRSYLKEITRDSTNPLPLKVLDLCSSWVSHLDLDTIGIKNRNNVDIIGLGMNEDELQSNSLLTHRIVHDLNEGSHIPVESDFVDIILLQLSIDYLIHPRDHARVLSNSEAQGFHYNFVRHHVCIFLLP